MCHFNEKYFFAFGGKALKEGTKVGEIVQPFDFVSKVEVYDCERAVWKVINYISESTKLRLINPASFQVTGKKIIIFGGAKPLDSTQSTFATDCGQKVTLSNETLFFNVSSGEIVRGPDMSKPAYFISGGYIFP